MVWLKLRGDRNGEYVVQVCHYQRVNESNVPGGTLVAVDTYLRQTVSLYLPLSFSPLIYNRCKQKNCVF
jgi:hypothetical protein